LGEYISVRVVSLRQLFSEDYIFRLPWFQRAYAWQTGEAGRLLTDLFDVAFEVDDAKRRYFLGSLMLAKRPEEPATALVDGHQRIMTLTLLFAVLRDLSADAASRDQLQAFIGTGPYRLQTQENLAQFCDKFVQSPGSTAHTPESQDDALSETERNIIGNRDYFLAELSGEEVSPATRQQLFETLADRCFVTIHQVEDEDEAWRMLVIEEETRRHFNGANRAKASLLSIIPQDERERCRQVWENCELQLNSRDMHALLGHLRTLKIRKRSERPVETDLAQAFALNTSGLPFIEGALAPAAAQLHALRRRDVGTLKSRGSIGMLIERLSWVSQDLWVPAALRWLDRRGENGETERFFSRLERLVWLLRLAGIDPTRQQRQIIRLLAEIDRDVPVNEMRELEIPKALRECALAHLGSNTFDRKHYAPKALRRIAVLLGADPGAICPVKVTVEHILPRGWVVQSQWRKHYKTEAAVKAHAHRLGNLTFLSAEENRAADACEWDEKRKLYAQSDFAMTRELADIDDWTPQVIENRTKRLARLLFDAWELPA